MAGDGGVFERRRGAAPARAVRGQRHLRGLRSYRRRFYRHMWWGIALVVLVELAIALYFDSTLLRLAVAFCLGVLAGVVWLAREMPPDHVRRWGDGAWGEQQTAKALEPLEKAGWKVQHDIELERGGNIDHIVESPTGKRFVLETKTLNGKISVETGFLTCTQVDDPEQVYRYEKLRHVVLDRARVLYRERSRGWVQAVVVIWGDFPQRRLEDGKLVFLHGDELAPWLREQAS